MTTKIFESLRDPAKSFVKMSIPTSELTVERIRQELAINFPSVPTRKTLKELAKRFEEGPKDQDLITFVLKLYELGIEVGMSREPLIQQITEKLKTKGGKIKLNKVQT